MRTTDTSAPVLTTPEIAGILSGEIAAVRAYERILDQLTEKPEANRLRRLYQDHVEAVDYWKLQPRTNRKAVSGLWSKAWETISRSPSTLEDGKALAALYESEEHGLQLYKNILHSFELSPAQKSYVRTVLLPAQETHMQRLEGMGRTSAPTKVAYA